MKVWIVCEPCSDPYYDGHPTGVVFSNEDKAKAYVSEQNEGLMEGAMLEFCALYLREGELK